MNVKKLFQYLLLLGSCVCVSAGYAEDSNPNWTYVGQDEWGALPSSDSSAPIPELYPYAECGLGKKQSPIDINDNSALKNSHVNGIRFAYHSAPLFVNNNGHMISVNIPQNNKNEFYIGKQEYELLQINFHAPSEHKIDGQFSKMEIQFFHATPSGKLAIVGVLVTINVKGKDNPEFQKILDIANGVGSLSSTIKPAKLLPSNKKSFYTYAGSFTTPPCTEGVDWYVLRYPLEVSATQVTAFQQLYFGNVRTTQDLNGRTVEKNFK